MSECVRGCFKYDKESFGVDEYDLPTEGIDFNLDIMIDDLLNGWIEGIGEFNIVIAYVADALVTCAKKRGWTLDECIEVAWNDIKDRKGLMVYGMFIKENNLDQLSELDIQYDVFTESFEGTLFLESKLNSAKLVLDSLGLSYQLHGNFSSGVFIQTTGRV